MASKTVVICDDVEVTRQAIKEILIKEGYEVVSEAEDGEMAINKYERYYPDLIILDISMPKIDGIEVTKKIVNKYPNAKIIVCSVISQQNIVIESIKAGAKDFIVKPFAPSRLLDSIRKVI